uniref:Complement C1q-like protein 4 n=1 Tax=Crassostrea virginica TaxID=6565 RepID=A0A8B8BCF6_CRAVI|nr:complement C1q-like protein 4 [Crassostrea virginica]
MRIGEQSKIRRIVPPTYPPANQDEPIAFYAYMSAPMSNIGGHHTVIFDVIKTNSGHGLHPIAGVFTAPKSGIYVFTWTIRVFNNSYHGTELVVNGQKVGALIPHSGVSDNDTGSTSVVVYVNEGENVFLRKNMISNNGGIHSDSNGYSSFSGWKLM